MKVVVVGGGIAGLGTALQLRRAGHEVTLVERDSVPPPDLEEAWDRWDRRGVPQQRLAHVFLGRMRNLLRDEQPDVYGALVARGANEIRLDEMRPSTLASWTPSPSDDDLVILGCRRVLLECVLREAIERDGVVVRSSTPVAGLIAATPPAAVPRITGVRLDDGSEVTADLVVDCSGRRSPLPRWLASIGARPPSEEEAACGQMYYGRYYRLAPGASYPRIEQVRGDYGFLTSLTFQADAGWFAIALAVDAGDEDIRVLRREAAFECAMRVLPHTAVWFEGDDRAVPAGDVAQMARLENRFRRLVDGEGPVVAGLVALGDSAVCTNPTYGRGSSLAWMQARALVSLLAEHDATSVVLAFDGYLATDIRPWYDQVVMLDEGSIAVQAAAIKGAPPPAPDPDDPQQAIAMGLQLAALQDETVYRGFARMLNLPVRADELLGEPGVFEAAVAAFEARDTAPVRPAGPTRAEFLDSVRAAI